MLDRGEALMVLDLPPGFQKQLMRGESARAQMQVDATSSVLGSLATSYSGQIVGEYLLEWVCNAKECRRAV
jgi:ABC-2 type transport system permease protein